MNPSRRKIGRRACDGCKVRKVKCAGVSPCARCVAAGIACTFNKSPLTRGPKSLRMRTIHQIAQAQRRIDDYPRTDANHGTAGPSQTSPGLMSEALPFDEAPDGTAPPQSISPPGLSRVMPSTRISSASPASSDDGSQPTPTHSLVLRLCEYRLRLFPVWPIVAVEEIMASLHRDSDNLETYALANAIGAATIAQLKSEHRADGDLTNAASMESECRRAQRLLQIRHKQVPIMSLDSLRISFFLHVYHENNAPGGPRSLLYLREAITVAQILGLHKEAEYGTMTAQEQQMRQRILWLLFVTERGVAMLHKLPVILKCDIRFLNLGDADDEAHVLPAFKKLVNLFWLFDSSGAFNLLQNSDEIQGPFTGGVGVFNNGSFERLQALLGESTSDIPPSNDVQAADICVTRRWMQAILWRASVSHGRAMSASQNNTLLFHPIHIARGFLNTISALPHTALEAHGPAMEYKIYEIARAVCDSVLNGILVPRDAVDRPQDVLELLHQRLASCRGGNKAILPLLRARIAEVQERIGTSFNIRPSGHMEEINEDEDAQLATSLIRAGEDATPGNAETGELAAAALSTPFQIGPQDVSRQQHFQERILPQISRDNNGSGGFADSAHSFLNRIQDFDGSFSDMDPITTGELVFPTNPLWDIGNWDWNVTTIEHLGSRRTP